MNSTPGGILRRIALPVCAAAAGIGVLAPTAEAANAQLTIDVAAANTSTHSVGVRWPNGGACFPRGKSRTSVPASGNVTVIGFASSNCADGTGLAGQNVTFPVVEGDTYEVWLYTTHATAVGGTGAR